MFRPGVLRVGKAPCRVAGRAAAGDRRRRAGDVVTPAPTTVRFPDAFAQAVVASLNAELAATKGGRSLATFRCAARLGNLVGAGLLDRDSATESLIAVARSTGLSASRARGAVRRGLRAGEATPVLVERAPVTPARVVAPVAPPPPLPAYPPAREVEALWSRALPVLADGEVQEWLRGRALDPDAVELWDLARALPRSLAVPAWAAVGSASWIESNHRLLLRLFDADGCHSSLRARFVGTGVPKLKSLAPTGFSTSGLVLACPATVQLLRGDDLGWCDRVDVVVVEGEPDFLTRASRQSDADVGGPFTLGIGSGSWTPRHAARIPSSARVVIRTHDDDAGDRYAAAVAQSLAGRCRVLRPRSLR